VRARRGLGAVLALAVVGWSNTAGSALHPFLWQSGRMTDLGTLDRVDGGWGMATDINRHGDVVGQSDRDGVRHAVRWQRGKITAESCGTWIRWAFRRAPRR
jgi:probable HAF family extracellular repeat protein